MKILCEKPGEEDSLLNILFDKPSATGAGDTIIRELECSSIEELKKAKIFFDALKEMNSFWDVIWYKMPGVLQVALGVVNLALLVNSPIGPTFFPQFKETVVTIANAEDPDSFLRFMDPNRSLLEPSINKTLLKPVTNATYHTIINPVQNLINSIASEKPFEISNNGLPGNLETTNTSTIFRVKPKSSKPSSPYIHLGKPSQAVFDTSTNKFDLSDKYPSSDLSPYTAGVLQNNIDGVKLKPFTILPATPQTNSDLANSKFKLQLPLPNETLSLEKLKENYIYKHQKTITDPSNHDLFQVRGDYKIVYFEGKPCIVINSLRSFNMNKVYFLEFQLAPLIVNNLDVSKKFVVNDTSIAVPIKDISKFQKDLYSKTEFEYDLPEFNQPSKIKTEIIRNNNNYNILFFNMDDSTLVDTQDGKKVFKEWINEYFKDLEVDPNTKGFY